MNRSLPRRTLFGLATTVALCAILHPNRSFADDSVLNPATMPTTTSAPTPETTEPSTSSGDTRYGLFGLLDHRSQYGQGAFPEPFLVDDSDEEINEARLDWLHTEGHGEVSNVVTAEVEKGFGVVTLEVEVPYEHDKELVFDPNTGQNTHNTDEGIGNIDLGARAPFYQYVSDDSFFDLTLGTAIEVGIPTNSVVSKNTEVVPKLFGDLVLGDHVTVQAIIGWSKLFGGGDDGGLETFEYGFVFGYTIPHKELPIPGVEQLIPVFELSGGTALNKEDAGVNSLLGNAAVRVNLKAIGGIQPRLGVGYVFPIDDGARDDFKWGVVTSLVFEY